ncbi:hypothetical protein MPLSOD_40457 [Mesorhizobium sp. SOD10]|nr:hypothetical protein MPLSOD_40457 [Mesorhizobium sp. SOD10]
MVASRRTKSLHRRLTTECLPFLRYGRHSFPLEALLELLAMQPGNMIANLFTAQAGEPARGSCR